MTGDRKYTPHAADCPQFSDAGSPCTCNVRFQFKPGKEREEMEAENKKEDRKVANVRGEMQRMIEGCRSMVITGVTPTGEMVTLCYYNGYADLRAIQVESMDRIREIIIANSKRLPTESV